VNDFQEKFCSFLIAYILLKLAMDSANANDSKESILTKKPPSVGSTYILSHNWLSQDLLGRVKEKFWNQKDI